MSYLWVLAVFRLKWKLYSHNNSGNCWHNTRITNSIWVLRTKHNCSQNTCKRTHKVHTMNNQQQYYQVVSDRQWFVCKCKRFYNNKHIVKELATKTKIQFDCLRMSTLEIMKWRNSRRFCIYCRCVRVFFFFFCMKYVWVVCDKSAFYLSLSMETNDNLDWLRMSKGGYFFYMTVEQSCCYRWMCNKTRNDSYLYSHNFTIFVSFRSVPFSSVLDIWLTIVFITVQSICYSIGIGKR